MAEEAKTMEDKLKEMMSRVLSAEEAISSVKQSLEALMEEIHIDIPHESMRPNKGREDAAQRDSGMGKSVDSGVVKRDSRDSRTVVMVQETPPCAKINRRINSVIMSSLDDINALPKFVRFKRVVNPNQHHLVVYPETVQERPRSGREHFDTTHSTISDEESK